MSETPKEIRDAIRRGDLVRPTSGFQLGEGRTRGPISPSTGSIGVEYVEKNKKTSVLTNRIK
jgi:hypothetical protein